MLLVFHNFYTVLHVLKFVIEMQIFKFKMFPVSDVPAICRWMKCHRARLDCAATWQYGADGG